MKRRLLSILIIGFFVSNVLGKITVNPYFQSGMVLQREKPIVVWGEANPGETFEISLDGDVRNVMSDRKGNWRVEFGKREASGKPIVMKVGDVVFDDILIGDVWICSGQSNMVFAVSKSDDNTKNINVSDDVLSRIRLMSFKKGTRLAAKDGYTKNELKRCNTENFFQAEWRVATIGELQNFSAVAAYFGITVSEYEKIPVGLVFCAVGGSSILNWMPKDVLMDYKPTSDLFDTDLLAHKNLSPDFKKRIKTTMNNVLSSNGEFIINKQKYHSLCEPSFLYESSFAKIGQVQVKGVVWYQGEADTFSADAIEMYNGLFPLFVKSWRDNFKNKDLPFILVQLPSFKTELWPMMRNVQYNSAKNDRNCHIIPTIDLGDNKQIHYKGKKSVGIRAAYMALDRIYNNKIVSFPEVNDCERTDRNIVVSFGGIAEGLKILPGNKTVDVDVFYGDGTMSTLEADLRKDRLIVPSKCKDVVKVRYAWRPSMLYENLIFNSDDIPLYPFEISFNGE